MNNYQIFTRWTSPKFISLLSHCFVSFSFFPNEQMTADVSPLLGPTPSLPNSILLLSNREGEKKEKMFQCLCLTDKINCTYKIQITLFNLKMIGPGPSPEAWSVRWCMAWVYSSSANRVLHIALQASRAEPGGVGCAWCDEARGPLMFNKPLFLTLDFNLEIWSCTCWKRGLLAGANLSFSFCPCLLQLSSPNLIFNPKQNERKWQQGGRSRRESEKENWNWASCLLCLVVLQACNKAQNVTGPNSHPQAVWDCGDLCSGMCVHWLHIIWED